MSTQTPTLDDFPTHLRDAVEAFAAGFLATVTDRDEITAAAIADALTRETDRVTVMATDHRHPTREALVTAMGGTYDQFRAAAGLAEGELLHMRP